MIQWIIVIGKKDNDLFYSKLVQIQSLVQDFLNNPRLLFKNGSGSKSIQYLNYNANKSATAIISGHED